VTWLAVAAGVAVALGAGVAIGARGPRTAILGALVALVFTPFTGTPIPASAQLGFQVAAAVLAAYLLLMAARRAGDPEGSPLGLPATLLGAGAAFVAGLAATAVGIPSFGSEGALAAGLALLAVALPPVIRPGDSFRLGIALVLLLDAGLLLRSALAGTPPALEGMVAGVSLVALAAAVAALVIAAARAAGEPERAGAAGPRAAAAPAGGTAALPVEAESRGRRLTLPRP
jgi:hypothetical protein